MHESLDPGRSHRDAAAPKFNRETRAESPGANPPGVQLGDERDAPWRPRLGRCAESGRAVPGWNNVDETWARSALAGQWADTREPASSRSYPSSTFEPINRG
jgi:hypothetical protein